MTRACVGRVVVADTEFKMWIYVSFVDWNPGCMDSRFHVRRYLVSRSSYLPTECDILTANASAGHFPEQVSDGQSLLAP